MSRRGVTGALGHYWVRLCDRAYERALGVSTEVSDPEAFGDLGRPSPSSYFEFRRLVKRLALTPENEVFLDYGSGLGRILIAAARYPFRRIIGLELHDAFHRIAERNIETCRRKLRCRDIELITGDAEIFRPPRDVTLFYFYNPFPPAIMEKTLENIRATRTPDRPMSILLRHPTNHSGVFQNAAWLEKTMTCHVGEYDYAVFESRGR